MAVRCQRVGMRQQACFAQAPDHAGQAARVVELLHQEAPRWLQIDKRRCAAANARPAARIAAQNEKHPDKMVTVFAGMEADAVNKARAYMLPYPPSSPAMALFKDGKLVHIIERHQIEGRPAQMIADNLIGAFEQYC